LSIFWIEAGAHLRICLFHKATIACWHGPSHRQSDLAEMSIESVRQLRAMSQSRFGTWEIAGSYARRRTD
jgi:hypothetical protein